MNPVSTEHVGIPTAINPPPFNNNFLDAWSAVRGRHECKCLRLFAYSSRHLGVTRQYLSAYFKSRDGDIYFSAIFLKSGADLSRVRQCFFGCLDYRIQGGLARGSMLLDMVEINCIDQLAGEASKCFCATNNPPRFAPDVVRPLNEELLDYGVVGKLLKPLNVRLLFNICDGGKGATSIGEQSASIFYFIYDLLCKNESINGFIYLIQIGSQSLLLCKIISEFGIMACDRNGAIYLLLSCRNIAMNLLHGAVERNYGRDESHPAAHERPIEANEAVSVCIAINPGDDDPNTQNEQSGENAPDGSAGGRLHFVLSESAKMLHTLAQVVERVAA